MEWLDALKISIPVLVAVVGWLLNERSKRRWEQYKRKEDRYVALLENLKGFYVNTDPKTTKESKDKFLSQLNVAWLYCPDTIIRTGYRFLGLVSVGGSTPDEERDLAAGELVSQMRKDLLGQTELGASDYRHLRST